ncbi:MAG: T9SS type A sorting domain-containing protein [Flavobacteriales bacterium]|nr:T9SS type A sorting domain-containing protein [Flavobacteriales bacterium]
MLKESSLPQEFKDIVEAGQFKGVSDKEIFESDLASLAQEASELRQDLLRYFLIFDEDANTDGNEMLEEFFIENESANDIHLLSALRRINGDYVGAYQALAGSSNDTPTKYLYRPLSIILESMQSQQYPILNSSHLAEIEGMSVNENEVGSAQARALHALVSEETYPMEIDTHFDHLRSYTVDEPKKQNQIPFKIQPIPADDVVWLTFPYHPGMEEISLSVIDIQGREVFHTNNINAWGIFEINTHDWSAGFYLVKLSIDGHSLGTTKLEIRH